MSATPASPWETMLLGAPCRVNPLRQVGDPPEHPRPPQFDGMIVGHRLDGDGRPIYTVVCQDSGNLHEVGGFAIRVNRKWIAAQLHPIALVEPSLLDDPDRVQILKGRALDRPGGGA